MASALPFTPHSRSGALVASNQWHAERSSKPRRFVEPIDPDRRCLSSLGPPHAVAWAAPRDHHRAEPRERLAMRWVTVQTERGPRACGLWEGRYVDLNAADPALPARVRSLLALGPDGLRRAAEALPRGMVRHDPATATLLAPIPDPPKIVCLGLNYRDHAEESGMAIPSEPILFSKYASSLIGHGAEILLPEVSSEVDYEAELVVVVGQGGRDIPRERAYEHVAGYTVGHDVSARDWQLNKPGKQWMAGKTFDT